MARSKFDALPVLPPASSSVPRVTMQEALTRQAAVSCGQFEAQVFPLGS
jgi:hypothetical protein